MAAGFSDYLFYVNGMLAHREGHRGLRPTEHRSPRIKPRHYSWVPGEVPYGKRSTVNPDRKLVLEPAMCLALCFSLLLQGERFSPVCVGCDLE